MKVRLKIRTLPSSAREIFVVGVNPSPSCNDSNDINNHSIKTECITDKNITEDERSRSNPSTSASSEPELEWVMGTFETIKSEGNDLNDQSSDSESEPEVVEVESSSDDSKDQISSSGTHGDIEPHMSTQSVRAEGSKKSRQWKCQDCDKKFKQRAFLDAHRRSHLNIRPFACQLCRKTFTQVGNLSMHMRVHDGLKPYTCGHCGRAFSQKGNLQQHIMAHEGRKPFDCTICGKTFTQKGNLKSHMSRHNEFKFNLPQ